MTDAYTENFADFRIREVNLLQRLLAAWLDHGLPRDFFEQGVRPGFNRSSGYVFLTNDDYQVAMMNGERLESFYSLPHGGEEGFLADLLTDHLPEDLHPDDVAYLLDLAEAQRTALPPLWLAPYSDGTVEDV